MYFMCASAQGRAEKRVFLIAWSSYWLQKHIVQTDLFSLAHPASLAHMLVAFHAHRLGRWWFHIGVLIHWFTWVGLSEADPCIQMLSRNDGNIHIKLIFICSLTYFNIYGFLLSMIKH